MLNSLYGALGNAYFSYYDLRIAEGITKTGQLAIRWIERKLNEKLNNILKTSGIDYCIASDTDSIYLNMGAVVELLYKDKDDRKTVQFLNKISIEVLQPFIQSSYEELAEYINAYEPALHMKLEGISKAGVFLKKKRYILEIFQNEGVDYDPPETKVMGIELVKSSTPPIVRDTLKKSIPIVLYGTQAEIIKYNKNIKETFNSEPLSSISFNRGVTDMNKWQSKTDLYISRTPIHVRASIMYNYCVEKFKLQDQYQLIKNGDKIKFIYLKVPNPMHEDVIAYLDELPVEFGLHQYIDYTKQYESAFEKSLTAMIEPMQWELHPRPKFDM